MSRKVTRKGKSQATKGAEADVVKTLATLEPELARLHLRKLLLANPNYFGTLEKSAFKAALKIQGDTAYEQLGCVGFQPQLNRLEAPVYIKRDSGYSGDVCSDGSQEYVRFYLSFDDGTTWRDQGMTSFTAYDVPGTTRLEYAVTLPIDPAKTFCFVENIVLVRAILSWNNPPPANTPNFTPIWGNVVDAHIQIAPGSHFSLGDVLEQAKAKLAGPFKATLDLSQTVQAAEPKTLTAGELHALYKDTSVPGHRSLFAEVDKLAAPGFEASLAKSIDVSAVVAQLLATSGDTSFEQLDCIGFDSNRDALIGVLTAKRPSGFSGGLCTVGSYEYVAFWIDWGDGAGWTHAGTASVNVHDLKTIPADGLQYAVYLPVDVGSHRRPCSEGPRTAHVRAILSWQASPPPWNPDYVPTWGNRRETRIHIKPGQACGLGAANIAILGGIGIADIDTGPAGNGMTTPTAKFALTGDDADAWHLQRACPFGGRVVVQGCPSPGYKYRVWVRTAGSSNEIKVTKPIRTVDFHGIGTTRSPDLKGFFTYLSDPDNIDDLLAWWDTAGDDLWEIRLEVYDPTGTVFQNSTPWYRIQLDNTAPTVDIHIDSGGDCKDFMIGGTVNGHFVAQDLHFGGFALSTEPNTVLFPSNPPTTPTSSTSQTVAAPGDPWTLDLSNPVKMKPCGYVVRVVVSDRSIVGSSPFGHNANGTSVGFCLRAKV